MDKFDAERAFAEHERELEELEELRKWDARKPEVQVRVLRAAVNVIYGKDLAAWVVEEVRSGRMKLEIPE